MTGFFFPPMLAKPSAAIADASSSSADVRWAAAMALGQVDGALQPSAVEALDGLLSDPIPEVRAQAVEGLAAQCRSGAKLEPLWPASVLDDPSPAVRCAAVDAVLLLSTQPEDLLLPLVRDPDPSVRMAAAAALGDVGDPCACEPLRGLLLDDDPSVGIAAASALAFLGDKAAEPILLERLDAGLDDMEDAIFALGRIRSEKALPGLKRAAGRLFAATSVKAAAAVSIYACTNGGEGRDLISRLLAAKKARAKVIVLSAICRLPAEGLVDTVSHLLADTEEMVASCAIQTLAALSVVDEDAKKALSAHKGRLSGALAEDLDEAILHLKSKQP